ncbi:MAG TPA: rhomboid family intramembrane serine protease [Ktedonobacterales bacterium]
MEQTMDARSLIEKGDALLKEARAREAAAEYARAAQLDPNAVGAHLGLAEANVALGQFSIVAMACQAVQRLAPETPDAFLAQAIDATLAQRYDNALALLDRVAELDPTRAYTYALRGYILRQLRQSYDASLAESKAARMSGTHDLTKLFPPVNPVVPEVFATPLASGAQTVPPPPQQHDARPWNQRSAAERAAVRTRFATRNLPVVTFALMIINVGVYLVGLSLSGFDLLNTVHTDNPLYVYGVEFGTQYMNADPTQWYRVLTAMFLHLNIYHIGVNMLSLYFVGVVTEQIFGHWRFLGIYLASGVIAGVAQAFFLPAIPTALPFADALATGNAALGASGAIFGIFGAFGVFFLLNRRALGPAANIMIGQWAFWLLINILFTFSAPGIGIADHIGGLLSGMGFGALLAPSLGRR